MRRQILKCFVAGALILLSTMTTCRKEGENEGPPPTSFGIDHTCADLAQIPAQWIDSVKANIKVHYAHTSHGEQLTIGAERIENANVTYNVTIEYSSLPSASGSLGIFDGQENEAYITPDLYWQTAEGMNFTRAVLDNNPSIKVSMWCWCTQLDYYTEDEVQVYLDSMTVLETEYPNVTFVYMTGNAQATDAEGYNRHLRNEQIRQYCEDHNKILFDFADLDCWWFNSSDNEWEYATCNYNGVAVPVEHPHFHGDEAGHTTYESCEQKGRALWWLMAMIAGWAGS